MMKSPIDAEGFITRSPRTKGAERPVFRLRLRPERGVADPVRALRQLLKIALRRCGLRAVSCEQEDRR